MRKALKAGPFLLYLIVKKDGAFTSNGSFPAGLPSAEFFLAAVFAKSDLQTALHPPGIARAEVPQGGVPEGS
ncbi:hypothetical protein [Bacillus sp. FJAT-44742]|uniref:hypothetical protein n=1 Tax=Bacillus sp. FJAT-44742 TaxID=2014005 RepID=UPI000C24CBF6|nr:hypothetical protein [Bacillus sp. FJAT-44742]